MHPFVEIILLCLNSWFHTPYSALTITISSELENTHGNTLNDRKNTILEKKNIFYVIYSYNEWVYANDSLSIPIKGWHYNTNLNFITFEWFIGEKSSSELMTQNTNQKTVKNVDTFVCTKHCSLSAWIKKKAVQPKSLHFCIFCYKTKYESHVNSWQP